MTATPPPPPQRTHTGIHAAPGGKPEKSGAQNRSIKNIIINPRYQLRYTFWLTFSGLILVLMNAALFYLKIKENYDILVELSPMTDEAKAQLYAELRNIVLQLSGTSLVFVALTGLFGLIYSHRTAGPLFHFKRVFEQIKNGNRTARIRLRPNDDFKDVAAAFNDMMDTLNR
jgi:methyl-accepting chemotaxis protein